MIDMHPTMRQALVLYSPAVVLTLWAVVCAADDGDISGEEAAIFLLVLAISVAAAKWVRNKMHRKFVNRINQETDVRDKNA